MTDEQSDSLDLILNAAMREYSNARPRPGLEQRLLRHVHTTPRRQSRWKFAWVLGIAATAVVVLLALQARRISAPLLALLPPPVPRAAPLEAPAPPSHQRTSSRRPLRRLQEAKPLPMTAEERLLLRLVREQPALAEAALAPPQSDHAAALEALTVEPLKIEQLQLP